MHRKEICKGIEKEMSDHFQVLSLSRQLPRTPAFLAPTYRKRRSLYAYSLNPPVTFTLVLKGATVMKMYFAHLYL
jgi:hypothetical protein